MKIILISTLLFISNITFAQQWQYLGLGTESISTIAVDWSNSNIIYAGSSSNFSAGTVGGIFKSTNGGASWDTLIRGVTARTFAIHPTNHNIIYATLGINFLTQAGIIKSTDAGATWTKADYGIRINAEEGPTPFAIDLRHPDTVYTGTAGPFGGKFYRSTNGGMSWYSQGDSTALRDGVTAIAVNPESSNVVYAGTAWRGNLLKSTNYGVDWEITTLPQVGIVYDILVDPFNSQQIYVGAWYYGFLKTTDGGITWSNFNLGLPDIATVSGIQILNGEKVKSIFIVANWNDNGGIYQSVNGNVWKKIGIDTNRVTTIKLVGNKLYGGYYGIYLTDILTVVQDKSLRLPAKFNLYNNFPNPFNPSTKITYEIGVRGFVLLEIFDIQGKELKTLVRKEQLAGKYSSVWNGENENRIAVSSGAYFYVLRAGGQVTAKKMIYLR